MNVLIFYRLYEIIVKNDVYEICNYAEKIIF